MDDHSVKEMHLHYDVLAKEAFFNDALPCDYDYAVYGIHYVFAVLSFTTDLNPLSIVIPNYEQSQPKCLAGLSSHSV